MPQGYSPPAPTPFHTSAMQSMLHVLFLPAPFKSNANVREAEVIHPTAKLLVMASQVQESEMGVLLQTWSSFWQEKSENLLIISLHPSKEQPSNPFHSRRGTTTWKVIIAGSSTSNLALYYLNHFNIAVPKVLPKFDLRRVACVFNATHLARIGPLQRKQSTSTSLRQRRSVETVSLSFVSSLPWVSGTQKDTYGDDRAYGSNSLPSRPPRVRDRQRRERDRITYKRSTASSWCRCDGTRARQAYGHSKSYPKRSLRGAERINEVHSRLWVKHEQEGGKAWGVDIKAKQDGTLLATDFKILDPLPSKRWAIKLATRPKVPQQASNWDED
ncbi:hypothetical protein DFJ58DRAFT_722623 [Suillus subalutaceus]|uniref:uncharacterized protein n=1 Tax=Suillus subalutaceus TaxID=48586 RepID=UPI001B863409|nr:uncharacterized protein DFJ58DRAFT_722623 [Suillus subalutaceus]KAG1871874.1 hypothetical protein DFJ58DRAFT_722623 [Suillus subalutaceus]